MRGLDQQLARMEGLVKRNSRAVTLVHSIWEFFEGRVECAIVTDDGEPSRHRVIGIGDTPKKIGDVGVAITVRQSDRMEEAFVHELLHANLIRSGYPTFWIDEFDDSEEWRIGGGITNNADHVAMRPTYLSLGYASGRFSGISELSKLESRVIEELDTFDLSTPGKYLTKVSSFLLKWNVRHEAINLREVILQRRQG
jgi:hypothetical protein